MSDGSDPGRDIGTFHRGPHVRNAKPFFDDFVQPTPLEGRSRSDADLIFAWDRIAADAGAGEDEVFNQVRIRESEIDRDEATVGQTNERNSRYVEGIEKRSEIVHVRVCTSGGRRLSKWADIISTHAIVTRKGGKL